MSRRDINVFSLDDASICLYLRKLDPEKMSYFSLFGRFCDTPLLNCFGGVEAQEQKRKIPYVKPLPAFDLNRKSNVKLRRNHKFFACFNINVDELRPSNITLRHV